MNEPIHYVVANEPVGTLFCGPTVWESSRTDRVTTQRRLVTCPNCLRKLAARAAPAAETGKAQGPWRVGNHYGIHVYEDQRPVATCHREEDARRCVAAVNGARAAPPEGEGKT